jgi:hypothetical protein
VLAGSRFGTDRSLNYALAFIPVGLVSSSGSIVQWTMTDASGAYTLRNIDNAANYKLQLLKHSLLDDGKLRIAGRFLRVGQYEVFGGDAQLGFPHALSSPNFQLLLDDEAVPFYARPQVSPLFEGDSKPLSYWAFQESGYAGSSRLRGLTAIETAANALVGCTTSFNGLDDLQNNLRAAALNAASGRGFFEPYDLIQEWYLAYASHIFCSQSSSSSDQALALRFARAINMADDLDTYGNLSLIIKERQ